MELRTRQLSDAGQQSGDEAGVSDIEMGSIGDLEIDEIEEITGDEEIQRYISQSHTPAASRRPTPHHSEPESSDNDDDFETAIRQEDSIDMQPADIPAVEASGAAVLPVGADEMEGALRRCRELAQRFREKYVAKLPPLQFLDAATYRRYTVVTALMERPMGWPRAQQQQQQSGSQGTLQSPVQKPSSLRSGGGQVRDEQAARVRTVPAAGQAKDDVVGALLGAMQAPGAKTGGEQSTAAPPPQPLQEIPNDMLAAMAALEGGPVGAAKPRSQPAPSAAGETSAVQHPAAIRLPRNYSGPFSQLTAEEHARYLYFSRQQQQQQQQAQRPGVRDHTEYLRLKQRVEAEQADFRMRLREHMARQGLQQIEPHVQAAGMRLMRRQLEHAQRQYAAAYVAARVVAIRPVGGVHVPLVYRETVVQRGKCYGAREVLDQKAVEEAVVGMASEEDGGAEGRVVMSSDPAVGKLAARAMADVAVCDEALAALLTLQTMQAHDVLVPVEVRIAAEDSGGGRPLVVVDRPLIAGRAATPRKLRQLVFDAAVRRQTADRSGARGTVALGADSDESPACFDASYTVWELGGTRLLVRCAIDAFEEQEAGGKKQRVTVTGAAKLEYFDPLGSPEEAVVAGETGRVVAEEVQPAERLAWWLAAFLRGSPSQVWVAHVAPGGQVVRQARMASGELYADSAAAQQQQPPTHALREILGELRRLAPGRYMLQHRRGTWDATLLRAVEDPAGERAAVVSLQAELAELPLDNDADFAPPVWRGLGPGHVPWTYPPVDLKRECEAAGEEGGDKGVPGVKKRRKVKGKAKAKGKRKRTSE